MSDPKPLTHSSPRADLTSNCLTDSASNIVFGVYDPLAGADVDVTNPSIVMRCTKNTSYTITLSTGGGGNFSPRKIDSAGVNTDQLSYNLYTPSGGFTTIRGDGTGGTSTARTLGAGILAMRPGDPHLQRPPVRRPRQDMSADTYADTVTVTISYRPPGPGVAPPFDPV